MKFQYLIKIFFGAGVSALLMLGLSGCASNREAPVSTAEAAGAHRASSFASSTVCANNPFLQRYQCSFTRIEQAARSGDPDAQYALGYLYYYGIGTTQDRQTGLVWIRKAAAQGQSVAQQALKTLSSSQPVKSKSGTSSSAPANDSSSSPSNHPQQPDKPLTDYLPNYGEKRVDTTATPPPSVNLSAEQ
jgi:TPR repeat protein